MVLPDTVETIGEGAFAWCENLKKIDIPDGTTSIGKSAFAQCESLGRISVPDSVTSIGEKCFQDTDMRPRYILQMWIICGKIRT